MAAISRFVMRNIPTWLWRMVLAKMSSNRPQVSFLPLVKDIGTVKSAHQPSLHKTQKILREKEAAKNNAAAALVA